MTFVFGHASSTIFFENVGDFIFEKRVNREFCAFVGSITLNDEDHCMTVAEVLNVERLCTAQH